MTDITARLSTASGTWCSNPNDMGELLVRRHIHLPVFLFAILLSAPGIATSQEIGVGVDGETWHQMGTHDSGRLEKLILLKGIYDGLVFGRSPDVESYPMSVSWETLIDGLDQFYEDFANRKMFVVWSLRVLYLQLSGESQQRIDGAIRNYRCRAAAGTEGLRAEELDRRLALCRSRPNE